MDLVSIIIPVYNTEQYLRQALDSVINQTYKNLEIICIDDGSTDNSRKILNEYAKKDSRIKIIHHKKNKGVSTARNAALNVAKGTYIMFLDSDDYYVPKTVEYAYKDIVKNNGDIVVFVECHLEPNVPLSPSSTMLFCQKHYPREVPVNNLDCLFFNFVWNKIFRRKFLSDNNIKFNKDLNVGEDAVFCIFCILNNAKVYTLPKLLYFKRIVNHSPEKKVRNDNGIMPLREVLNQINYYAETDLFKMASDECKVNIIDSYFSIGLLNFGSSVDTKYKLFWQIKIFSIIRYLKKWVGLNVLKKCQHYNEFVKKHSNKFLVVTKKPSLKSLLNYRKIRKNIKISG